MVRSLLCKASLEVSKTKDLRRRSNAEEQKLGLSTRPDDMEGIFGGVNLSTSTHIPPARPMDLNRANLVPKKNHLAPRSSNPILHITMEPPQHQNQLPFFCPCGVAGFLGLSTVGTTGVVTSLGVAISNCFLNMRLGGSP